MQCFIVAPDRDEARSGLLARLAGQLGYETVTVPALAALDDDPRFGRATRPLVLVVHGATDPVPARPILDFVEHRSGHAFVVVVADAIAADAYKQLVRTGSAEWIRWPDIEAELGDLAGRLLGAGTIERSARILSFLPSKGGVGNTTLVVEAAICLSAKRKRANRRVAILDLNLQGGTVADALDIAPRFDIAEIVGRPERLDEQLIDVFTSRHSPRLDVFAGPSRLTGLDDVEPQIVFAFVDSISSRYDVLLLDLPSYWLPWTDDLLQGSDAVVVSGGGTVPALRMLTARLRHLTGIGIPESRLAAVVNQVEVDLLGRVARRPDIERVLAGYRSFFVRRDSAAVAEASDVGRPLMELMPNARVARDIRRVGDWIETIVDRPALAAPVATPRQGFAA